LAVAVCPSSGGWVLELMKDFTWSSGAFTLSNLHLLFLISGMLQLVTLLAILRVQEVGSLAPGAVIMQLRNDLDPQTGLASATDFVTVKAGATTGFLRTLDRHTDDWADRSERAIAASLDRLERPLQRPLRAFRTLT